MSTSKIIFYNLFYASAQIRAQNFNANTQRDHIGSFKYDYACDGCRAYVDGHVQAVHAYEHVNALP